MSTNITVDRQKQVTNLVREFALAIAEEHGVLIDDIHIDWDVVRNVRGGVDSTMITQASVRVTG